MERDDKFINEIKRKTKTITKKEKMQNEWDKLI